MKHKTGDLNGCAQRRMGQCYFWRPKQLQNLTAVFKMVDTFNIDFASHDSNRTQQNELRSCDSNFVRKTIEIEQIRPVDIQIERTVLFQKVVGFVVIS